MTTAVTGAQYQIAAGDYAAVVTELGAGLRDLRYRGESVIATYPQDELPPGAAGQLLIPWPNRVDGGRFQVAGTHCQLDLSEPGRGNAIHGLARWAAWTLVRHTPWDLAQRLRLLGQAGYPFCLDITSQYRLTPERGLTVSVAARNVGRLPAPYGAGAHPYLDAGLVLDECDLALPCSRWLPTDDRGIPCGPLTAVDGGELDFRRRRRIGVARLDHALTGLARDQDGRAWARLAGSRSQVSLWAGPGYGWLQVYTGDTLRAGRRRRALAVEPMTCPPNAFVTGTDLIMLRPGAEARHVWGIQAGWRGPGVNPLHPGRPARR